MMPSFSVGGAEQMACHLMIGLAKSCDVACAGLYPAANTPIEKRLKAAQIPTWHLGKRPGFDPRLFWRIDRLLREVRPHVVHTHLSVLRYALPALLRRRIPAVVHTLHNLAEYETDAVGRLVHRIAFRAKVVPVAISREVAASFRRVYGFDCRALVPNGIPLDCYYAAPRDRARWRAEQGLDPEAVVFICVGRLDPQKNPLILVDAFAALDHPRAHLLMLGIGALYEEVLAAIRRHKLERRVHVLGRRTDVPRCLNASDVFVLASNWEGNPLAVMEAMAAGLPVIGTAVGGVPELVNPGQHGLLVEPGDTAAFTTAMRSLLNDPARRASLALAARARAIQAFGVDLMTQGYVRLYQRALSGASYRTAA